MAKEEKRSFVLYYEYRDHLQILSDEERGKLLLALMDYGATGEAPTLTGAALMAFSFITSQMDRDAEKYAEKCKKRSEAGKQGGRPRKAKETEDDAEKAEPYTAKPSGEKKAKKANAFYQKQSKAKKGDNDNENDNEDDNENDNDNDSTPLPPSKGGNKALNCNTQPYYSPTPTPYKAIVALYHEICTSYPRLRSITENRKALMDARWAQYNCSLDTFRELFTKAEASKFLKGNNKSETNWKADFNWLMDEDNMLKVLEEKYDETDFYGFTQSHYDSPWLRSAILGEDKEEPETAAENEELRKRGEDLKARLSS